MDSFLQQTARSIIDTIDWKQLNSTTLVLPSHRAGLVLKDELLRLQQERHAQAVWAPQVQTLPQLQDALSPLYAEDELFTIVRLYKLYCQSSDSQSDLMPLDMFYGWGRQMLADFTNIDASMPAEHVPNFFENTIAAHELSQWQLDPEVEERLRSLINPEATAPDNDSIRHQYELLWRQLFDLYQALRAEMTAEQKGYSGLRQRAVIEHWDDEELQDKIAGRTYIFVGFNYLLPVERELMTLLRDAGQAYFYWDYVADFLTNEKAFSFTKINSELLGSALPPRQWNQPREVTIGSCISREAQAQFVHSWLLSNYTAHGQRVGVVICDETMLEPVIYTLPAITLPGDTEPQAINITKGFPLRNTSVYARVLAWFADRQNGQSDDIVTPETIDKLLAHLFPVTAEDEQSPDSSDVAAPLSWQELLILESEYQVRKIANQMRALIAQGIDNVPFTHKLLRLLMRRTMENVTMPFHGDPVTDIQVMGVLETRMLDFDRLLLLNVEEGILPQRQQDISFIPFYLRKAYHMQTSDERATVYAYNFFRLLSRAGHSTLLFASAETAEGGKGMSRFIMQMLVSPEFIVQKMALTEHSILSVNSFFDDETAQPSLLSTLSVNANGQLVRSNGKRYRISPSALNTFISCRRSFYLQYILGLRPKEEEEVLFEPNTLGSFVHHTMQYIYTAFLHCDNEHPVPVQPDDIERIRKNEELLQEALMAAYKAMNMLWEEDHPGEKEHYIPDHHASENIIIIGYVKNILERDQADAAKGLQIYLLEQERTFPVVIDGVGELLTGGKIDRLDIYGSEGQQTLRVVDYKSGAYNDSTHKKKMSSSWDELMESEDKNYVRQTLVYSHAVQANDQTGLPVEPNLYFCRRKLTEIETTIDIDEQTVHNYKDIEPQFTQALQTKIKEVLTTTAFPPCDDDNCPAFCPFFSLCGRQPKEF